MAVFTSCTTLTAPSMNNPHRVAAVKYQLTISSGTADKVLV